MLKGVVFHILFTIHPYLYSLQAFNFMLQTIYLGQFCITSWRRKSAVPLYNGRISHILTVIYGMYILMTLKQRTVRRADAVNVQVAPRTDGIGVRSLHKLRVRSLNLSFKNG